MKKIILAIVVIFLTPFAVHADPAAFRSDYTNLSDCKVVPSPDDPAGSFSYPCPGRDGYQVFENGGDERSWFVFKKGKVTLDLNGIGNEELTFPEITGTKLEWRYRVVNGAKKLNAFIFRMSGDDKNVSLLYVVRVTANGGCVIGHAKTNEESRKLADSDKGC